MNLALAFLNDEYWLDRPVTVAGASTARPRWRWQSPLVLYY